MAAVGDKVRFLNSIGGGVIRRIDGKIAYVEEDGFETPVLLSEIVVVLPVGHESAAGSKYFDQEAFEQGKKRDRKLPEEQCSAIKDEEDFPIEETAYGDNMNILLGFEPEDIKTLSSSKIGLSLINDSNYFLSYTLLIRDEPTHTWRIASQGEVAPNELKDLQSYSQSTITELERIVFQAVAFKKDKPFEIKSPINVSKKLDLTKFFKAHCFRPGVYFENPAIELPLYMEKRREAKR